MGREGAQGPKRGGQGTPRAVGCQGLRCPRGQGAARVCVWVLTDEVGGFGGHEEVGQVEPLDERRVDGEGLAPAPRIVWGKGWAHLMPAPPTPNPLPGAGSLPTHGPPPP